MSKFEIIPEGTEGVMHFGPKESEEHNLHIHQIVKHLESRGILAGVKLDIDVWLDPKGVIITWNEKKEEDQN